MSALLRLILINTTAQSLKTTTKQSFQSSRRTAFKNNTFKMQFSALVLSAVALFGSMTFAAPAPSENLQVRSSCQLGDIWGAGDAACSASV